MKNLKIPKDTSKALTDKTEIFNHTYKPKHSMERLITYYYNGKEFISMAVKARDSYFEVTQGAHRGKFIHVLNLAKPADYAVSLLDVAQGRAILTKQQIEACVQFIGQGINDSKRLSTIKLNLSYTLGSMKARVLAAVKFDGDQIVYHSQGDEIAEKLYLKELFTRIN